MVFLGDGRCAPFAAWPIASGRDGCAVGQRGFGQHIHLVEITGDIVAHLDVDPSEHRFHIVREAAFVGKAVHDDLTVQQGAGRCVLPTELSVQAVFGIGTVDISHHRGREFYTFDARGIADLLS